MVGKTLIQQLLYYHNKYFCNLTDSVAQLVEQLTFNQ